LQIFIRCACKKSLFCQIKIDGYIIHVPIWEGNKSSYNPFGDWKNSVELEWYQAYNSSKHDRHSAFKQATLKNLINATAGLLVILSSQFRTENFSSSYRSLAVNTDSYYDTEPALGGFFHVEFPDDWTDDEKYEFDWSTLKKEKDRFEKINYDIL